MLKSLALAAISTHAPAGGATQSRANHAADCLISTHAPAGGATRSSVLGNAGRAFLLTPLREGRHIYKIRLIATKHFYSRPCGRGDAPAPAIIAKLTISTHAPAGGATRMRANMEASRRKISTHAPAGGATCVFGLKCSHPFSISTHAPAGGATQEVE